MPENTPEVATQEKAGGKKNFLEGVARYVNLITNSRLPSLSFFAGAAANTLDMLLPHGKVVERTREVAKKYLDPPGVFGLALNVAVRNTLRHFGHPDKDNIISYDNWLLLRQRQAERRAEAWHSIWLEPKESLRIGATHSDGGQFIGDVAVSARRMRIPDDKEMEYTMAELKKQERLEERGNPFEANAKIFDSRVFQSLIATLEKRVL